MQLLKAIGVINENSKKSANDPYQETVMVPLDEDDERDIDKESEDESEDGNKGGDDENEDDWVDEDEGNDAPRAMAASCATLIKVLPAIGKVWFI